MDGAEAENVNIDEEAELDEDKNNGLIAGVKNFIRRTTQGRNTVSELTTDQRDEVMCPPACISGTKGDKNPTKKCRFPS